MPEGDAHADTVRHLAAHTEAVRDALYELYCDAADDRLAPLVGPGTALERHVRDSYGWCVRVVGLLATVTNGLRARGRARLGGRQGGVPRRPTQFYPIAPPALREVVRRSPSTSRAPSSRCATSRSDLDELFASTAELQSMLAKRFA